MATVLSVTAGAASTGTSEQEQLVAREILAHMPDGLPSHQSVVGSVVAPVNAIVTQVRNGQASLAELRAAVSVAQGVVRDELT